MNGWMYGWREGGSGEGGAVMATDGWVTDFEEALFCKPIRIKQNLPKCGSGDMKAGQFIIWKFRIPSKQKSSPMVHQICKIVPDLCWKLGNFWGTTGSVTEILLCKMCQKITWNWSQNRTENSRPWSFYQTNSVAIWQIGMQRRKTLKTLEVVVISATGCHGYPHIVRHHGTVELHEMNAGDDLFLEHTSITFVGSSY